MSPTERPSSASLGSSSMYPRVATHPGSRQHSVAAHGVLKVLATVARATRTDPKKGGGSGSGQRGDVAARCRCVPQFLLPSLTCETSATTVQLFKAELVRAQLPVLGLEAHLGDALEGARALADFEYGFDWQLRYHRSSGSVLRLFWLPRPVPRPPSGSLEESIQLSKAEHFVQVKFG